MSVYTLTYGGAKEETIHCIDLSEVLVSSNEVSAMFKQRTIDQ